MARFMIDADYGGKVDKNSIKKSINIERFSWVMLILWAILSFGVLMHFEPPRWIASYCQS